MAREPDNAPLKRRFKLPGLKRAGSERWREGWKSDVMLGITGVALGLTCAFFPWYIFYNQEKFGVRAMTFEGIVAGSSSSGGTPVDTLTPALEIAEIAAAELDNFSVGSIISANDAGDHPKTVVDQPFPAPPPPEFRLLHAANGRAMLEDDTGIWIVKRGAVLPDDSRVTAIEQRKGGWVVVTDTGAVLETAR